jgi:hypothetical protein
MGLFFLANILAWHYWIFAANGKGRVNEKDFMIKDFGIGDDGNPFIVVEGTAGGTIAKTKNTALLYVFDTDNGTYGVMSDWSYTRWHSHGMTLDENNCIVSLNGKGGAKINEMVELTRTNATKVNKVMTAEYTVNDSEGTICPSKIFDSAS